MRKLPILLVLALSGCNQFYDSHETTVNKRVIVPEFRELDSIVVKTKEYRIGRKLDSNEYWATVDSTQRNMQGIIDTSIYNRKHCCSGNPLMDSQK
jgi:hypothetical protein